MSASADGGERSRSWRVVALIVLAAVLPYLPTLGYGFLRYDDPQFITREPFWQAPSLDAALGLFRRPVWGSYHPLHQLSYLLDRALWGPTPVGVRVTQAALYAACTWLVLVVGRRLRLAPAACAFAGLAFAWHPAHVENVAWASQRKDLLSAAFTLGAIAAYLGRAGAGPARARSWGLVFACFALGLLSKSVTVVALPILAALALALGRARRDAVWIAGLGVVGAAAARVHYLAQASVGATNAPPASRLEHLRVVTRALAGYARDVVAPVAPTPLSPPTPAPGGGDLVAAVALLATAALVAWAWRRGARRPAVLALWFFAALAPTSGLVPVPTFTQDRYLLLPSVGAALLAGDLLARAGARAPARRGVLAAAAVALVLMAAATTRYVGAWRDDVTLWSWTAATHPHDPRALTQMGAALADEGRWPEAERWTRLALAAAPAQPHANLVQGVLLLRRGEPQAAQEHLARAFRSAPGPMRYNAGMYLVAIAIDQGALDEAERTLELAAAVAPSWAPDVAAARAQLRLLGGDPAAAARLLEEAVRLAPGWQEGWFRLALARRLAGGRDGAREAALRAPAAGQRVLAAHLALDEGDDARAAATPLDDDEAVVLEAELVRARLEARRGDAAAVRARLASLAARMGRGALLRAALEDELRPYAQPR